MNYSYHKKFSICIVVILLVISQHVYAIKDIVLTGSIANSTTITNSTFSIIHVKNTIDKFEVIFKKTEKAEFIELLLPSHSKTNVVGSPQLPVISKTIEIPAEATPEVTILSYQVQEIKLATYGISQQLFPAQAPIPKNSKQKAVVAYNQQVYQTNHFYSEKLVRVEIAGYLRSVRLANLIISPVEYNPVSNTIKVYYNLEIEVKFTGADPVKTNQNKARTKSAYFNPAYTTIQNYKQADALPVAASNIPIKYVIVSDPMFESTLQPFIKWKRKHGFTVIEAYTNNPKVGKTFASIKAYLQNLYNSAIASDPAPTFVLFVGDVDQIPSYHCGTHVSDLYYCEYTGDYLPDVYYGRFSANNVAELQPQITKTLLYEQYRMPDPSYLNEVTMIAGADDMHQMTWSNGQIRYGTENYMNANHNLNSHTYLQPEPNGAGYAQKIKADISRGVAYANYTAHAGIIGWENPLFSISDIEQLQNKDKYGLVVGNCCQTNTFNQHSFGEALVRAENKGALGYIGAADLSFWDEDYWWSVGAGPIVANPAYGEKGLGAYDRMFHTHDEPKSESYSTMGQMVFAGNMAVQESNSGMKQYYWEIYCLMGDPSTMVYFSEPPALRVDHLPIIPLGANTFDIQTEPDAYIAISKNNILHGVSVADQNGAATVSLLPFTESGFADIVITKQNRKPFIDSIQIAEPAGACMLLNKFFVNDKRANNNLIAEYGESIALDITFQNLGNSEAINGLSTLRTDDAFVTITDSTYRWSRIKSKSSESVSEAFGIQISESIPDNHLVKFTLCTKVDTNIFTSRIEIPVQAPRLTNGNISLDDATYGNGNKQIEPGETLSVTVPISNTGHCTTENVKTQIVVISNDITSTSIQKVLGVLSPGTSTTSTFSFTVSKDATLGGSISIFAITSAGMHNAVTNITTTVGAQKDDFESNTLYNFNWKTRSYNPWKTCSSTINKGAFGVVSGQIGDFEQSEIYIEGSVFCDDSISFYRKVSSEEGYDFLKFYMDGIEKGAWSGEKDWEKVSFPINKGKHRLSWVYIKDEGTLSGQDAAWIDDIEFPALSRFKVTIPSVTVLAQPPVVCAGEKSKLWVLASGVTDSISCIWNPVSSLTNSNTLNPIASPQTSTTYEVRAKSKGILLKGSALVTVEPLPLTPVITIAPDHLISSSSDGNQWYTMDGAIAGANTPIFYPFENNTYFVMAKSASGCQSAASKAVVFVKEERNMFVSPNPFSDKLTVHYKLESASVVNMVVYNSLGVQMMILNEGTKPAGFNQAFMDGSKLKAGIYYIEIITGSKILRTKVIKG